MVSPALTQLLISACQASVQMHNRTETSRIEIERGRMQLRSLEMQLDHDSDIAEMQASVAQSFIHALIERRIDAAQSGFNAVLAIYADQARHYMQEQAKYTDADIMVTDPLLSANYRGRLSEIDRQLDRIRTDSYLLYAAMNEMLIIIGGSMPSIPTINRRTLRLPPED
jgi:hypothetical protein